MDSFESYKAMLEDMTPEERAAYWKRENARDNLRYINQMHESIQTDKRIIESTKQWLQRCVARFNEDLMDEARLKEHLVLGAETIEACNDSILMTRAEVAHYTKYPLYSEKRRQWYKTREGKQWQQRILNQLKKK